MLDIKFIRANADKIKTAAAHKRIQIDIGRLLAVDELRKNAIQEIESLKTEQNKLSKAKPDQKTIKILKGSKEKIAGLEKKLNDIDGEYFDLMIKVPVIPADDVPVGQDERDNVEVYKWGEPRQFDFTPKSHIELAEYLDLIDFSRGVKVAGYRGYFVKNEAVMLQMGLMMLALEKLIKAGYVPVIPPTLVKEFALFGSGYFAGQHFDPQIDEIYKIANHEEKTADGAIKKDDKFLIGTAEPSLLAYYADEIIDEKKLPIKLCGFSQCYRSEIGSYGKNTKGIYRVHEFMKVEMVALTRADLGESKKMHEEMMAITKELHEDLKIPYRQLLLCTGEMSAGKYKQYDFEAWIPSMNSYGETGSASNFLDWQSRRLGVRYKDGDQTKFVHMLNNTAIPSPRMLIAILENYQQADGSVLVPEVLQKYLPKKIIQR